MALPFDRMSDRLVRRSWGGLGRSWGRHGALLGPSWGCLGPFSGHVQASEAHRKRKGEDARIIEIPLVLEGGWPLGGLLRKLFSHLEPSGCALEAS